MLKEWRFSVQNMLDALTKIERYTAGLDYQAFIADDITVDAVLRNLAVIGATVRELPDSVTIRWPAIPWTRMRVLGDAIMRRYFAVDLNEVWTLVVRDLPSLAPQLKAVLENDRRAG